MAGHLGALIRKSSIKSVSPWLLVFMPVVITGVSGVSGVVGGVGITAFDVFFRTQGVVTV